MRKHHINMGKRVVCFVMQGICASGLWQSAADNQLVPALACAIFMFYFFMREKLIMDNGELPEIINVIPHCNHPRIPPCQQ